MVQRPWDFDHRSLGVLEHIRSSSQRRSPLMRKSFDQIWSSPVQRTSFGPEMFFGNTRQHHVSRPLHTQWTCSHPDQSKG